MTPKIKDLLAEVTYTSKFGINFVFKSDCMKKKISLFNILLLTAISFACKPEADMPEPKPDTLTNDSELKLSLNHLVDGKPLTFQTLITNDDGTRYFIDNFRYYLSKIRLIDEKGTEVSVPSEYQLVVNGTKDYQLGKVPKGKYTSLRFGVGIDSANNTTKDPTTYPKSSPLSLQSPSMFWTWQTGYIFMKLEGSLDPSTDQSEEIKEYSFKNSIIVHLGRDIYYREIEIPLDIEISDSPQTIELNLMVDKLLKGIDIKKYNFTHSSTNSDPLAGGVANNLSAAFELKK